MKFAFLHWNRLGISRKFNLAFSLLFFLTLVVIAVAFFSFQTIQRAEQDIRSMSEIRYRILEMDRGMERARRLMDDFFIYSPTIGLQKAHEQYAQPSVRQTARVINLSSELARELVSSSLDSQASVDRVNMNIYLAAARRFAEISIKAVELISERAAPERGIQARIQELNRQLLTELASLPPLLEKYLQAEFFYKDYLVTRQRFVMQSAFNVLDRLKAEMAGSRTVSAEQKQRISSLLYSQANLKEQLLAVDLKLAGIMHDFTLQEQIVTPISSELITMADSQVALAEQRIDTVYRLAGLIILVIALSSLLMIFVVGRVFHQSITRNILDLSQAASAFGRGQMEVRAAEESEDELGQLSRDFNIMAMELEDLVNNLEEKVARRTAELEKSEERFRNLLNDLPKIAVQGYDLERRVTYWNRASEDLYGYSREEALGRKLEDLIIPDSLRTKVVTETECFWKDSREIPSSELTLLHKEGREVQVYSSHVMQVNSEGENIFYCVDVDLSELKSAQEREQRTESFYRQLFDHSSSGVAVYEPVDDGQDFVFSDWNRAAEKIESVSREEVLGRKVSEVFPAMEEFGLLEVFRRVWQTGEPAVHPVSLYKDQRISGWRENRVYKLPSGQIVSVYDDISRQKQLEEEKQAIELRLQRVQKMEAIGLMAGGVAHDLNNILVGITGYPELLLMQLPADSELRQSIEAIKESGERAAAVVADLLTVARGVATKKQNADLNQLVREYLDSPECRHLKSLYRGIECQQHLAADLPDIFCSPVHIKKCIMNLMTNAAEAVGVTGVVTVSTSCSIPDRQWLQDNGMELMPYVILTVRDNGTGIPPESIEHIFEPFYTRKVLGRSGTGLGLAVVWNTVEDHKGKVFVESSDHGTCFRLYFPASTEGGKLLSGSTDKEPVFGHGEKILIVDDEIHPRAIAEKMLLHLGYSVEQAVSGEEAVELIRSEPVDLVLLDMLMDPGINGRQTYEQVRKICPGQKAIIVSGFSESDDVKTCIRLGAAGFIKKPYSMEQLGQAVGTALRG